MQLGRFFTHLKDYLNNYYQSNGRLPDGFPGHFITRMPLPKGNDVVDCFTFDPSVVAGRLVDLVHHVYEMPRDNANQLMQLIETNADAAEKLDAKQQVLMKITATFQAKEE